MDDFACTLAVCTLCFILVASLWLVPDVGKDLPLPFQRDWDLCSSSLPVSLTPVFSLFITQLRRLTVPVIVSEKVLVHYLVLGWDFHKAPVHLSGLVSSNFSSEILSR